MPEDVSTLRLYVMRFVYLLNFVLLGLDVWPALFRHPGAWDPVKGVPLLLLQLLYKTLWLVAVALPMWSAVRSIDLTRAMVIGVVVDLLGIPWSYVLATYVKERGDRWRQ
jgi:hypothetical protein